ncbi:uncharacterized protein LOC122266462 [Penaeus japonicus]|uniref:uncharacterized protein LOC122266462 n=1 Tax=Penaeus japonicus TaxID=27405 RepID=UPI001C710C1D|nr:uncharacterized protein LOC122266462 [Penaeus japonicus]
MPRKYVKKPPKAQDAETIRKATEEVLKKESSIREAASKYNVTQVAIRGDIRAVRGRPKRSYYSQATLEAALRHLQEEEVSVSLVSKQYGIPRSTLSDKLRSPCPQARKMTGKGPALNQEEEEAIKVWILERSTVQESLSWEAIASTVQEVLNERGLTKFKNNNRPTSGWLQSFLRRHPELTKVRLKGWTTGVTANPTEGVEEEEKQDVKEELKR